MGGDPAIILPCGRDREDGLNFRLTPDEESSVLTGNQDFLGHADLQTTGIYLIVSSKFLKEQHAKTHPSAMGQAETASVSMSESLAVPRLPTPAASSATLTRQDAHEVQP